MAFWDNLIFKKVLSSFGIEESMLELISTKPARDLTVEAAKQVFQDGAYKDMLMKMYNSVLQKRGEIEFARKLSETPEQTKERLRAEFEVRKQKELAAKSPELLKEREEQAMRELEAEFNKKAEVTSEPAELL